MVDQLTREHRVSDEQRPRRTWIAVVIVALVVAVVALGVWAVTGTGDDPAAIAGDLVDQFLVKALNNDDAAAAAELFTADGIVDMPDGRISHGHEEIVAHVEYMAPTNDSWERVGDVVEIRPNTFTYRARGNWHGILYEGQGQIEIDGDLIARFAWYGGHQLEL